MKAVSLCCFLLLAVCASNVDARPLDRSQFSIMITAGIGSTNQITLSRSGSYDAGTGFGFGATFDLRLCRGFLIGMTIEDNSLPVRVQVVPGSFNQHFTAVTLNIKKGALDKKFSLLPGLGIGYGELNEVETLPRCYLLVSRGSITVLLPHLAFDLSSIYTLSGTSWTEQGVRPALLFMARAGIRL